MEQPITERRAHREPWNKDKFVGQKAPLRPKEICAIRIRLQLGARTRELAPFNLAVDNKLRSCDLVKLRVRDVTHGEHIAARAEDYLFPSRLHSSPHVSTRQYARIVRG